MTELLTAVSIGAGNGSVYALLALGFVIIYKAMSVISFAQPAFMLSGAVLVSHLSPRMGFVAAVVVGTIAIAVVALVVERVAVRPMAQMLRDVGIDRVRGFSTNVSNYQTDADELVFAERLSAALGGTHWITDRGRNGNGATEAWCNPDGRALGKLPGTARRVRRDLQPGAARGGGLPRHGGRTCPCRGVVILNLL